MITTAFLPIILIALVSFPSSKFSTVDAQQNVTAEPEPAIGRAQYCESLKSWLDYAAGRAGEHERLFLVARLGKGETSHLVNQRRLMNVYRYFNYQREIFAERISKAEGEKIAKLGRIEIYVGSQLSESP